jgi:hypothetical protein
LTDALSRRYYINALACLKHDTLARSKHDALARSKRDALAPEET